MLTVRGLVLGDVYLFSAAMRLMLYGFHVARQNGAGVQVRTKSEKGDPAATRNESNFRFVV